MDVAQAVPGNLSGGYSPVYRKTHRSWECDPPK